MRHNYIITIASEKGGVGKTTVATNLAIYLKGLAEDLPVTVLSFDNHFTVDRMFRLEQSKTDAHVGQLFTEPQIERLICSGQYGVDFIPSCENLHTEQWQAPSIDHLARSVMDSAVEGILIIDTSPIFDQYTANALYAADRIVVPVKDASSLENCRHFSAFLSRYQRPKTLMKILPCMIDTRIHFDGPFQNTYQLLKAYAINRGYRCYEGYIAKSPKVESLATNPSGKIYPMISHARNTEVHLQMSHFARQIYLDYLNAADQC